MGKTVLGYCNEITQLVLEELKIKALCIPIG